ncbi:SpoIID/LytB domain-containing protein [Egicoccus sp. AB-alg2]|uniref:SpoIID/LytB domain-containing protein n=1 Tax=Egicoccus sp. AB-alg2 TaxID=3242693 RepID=UPI00359DF750
MADRGDRRARRRRPRPAATLLAATVAVLSTVVPTLPADAAEPVSGPLRVEVADGGVVEVTDHARGSRRFVDTLEFHAGSAGTLLVNDLAMEEYVAGVAEMPARWHLEALKAQAVAARTYAWYSIRLGTFTHYDICATVACQVFRGADTVLDSDLGGRWREAVDQTAGQVLVDDDGRPILARYFSTSGGRTYPNEVVFPDDGPRPFLVGTDDPADAVSPYHRWIVTFTREQFDDIIGRGDTLARAAPVADVRREGSVHDPYADVVVTADDGTEVRVGARQFREFVSRMAAERYPQDFPGVRGDGVRRLPETLPSSRFEIIVDDQHVVIEGLGWGHGVGLGQYGALGRAQQGEDHQDILAAYYDGLTPTASDDLPSRIRVGMDVGDTFTLRPSATMRILAGDTVVEEIALGAWTVERQGEDWALTPPDGHDADLEVAATRPAAGLDLGDAAVVETEVNKPVLLRLVVRDEDGSEVLVRDLGAADPGVHAATWRFEDTDGQPVPEGDYTLTLVGRDAAGEEDGSPHTLRVGAEAVATARERAADEDEAGGGTERVLLALVAPATLFVLLAAARRSRRSPA